MDDTQSYIEQMVAATTARAVPEPEPEPDFDEEGFDEQLDGQGEYEDVVPADGDFEEMAGEEFAEFEES